MRLKMKLVSGILEWQVVRWLVQWLDERTDELRRLSELDELARECPPAQLSTPVGEPVDCSETRRSETV